MDPLVIDIPEEMVAEPFVLFTPLIDCIIAMTGLLLLIMFMILAWETKSKRLIKIGNIGMIATFIPVLALTSVMLWDTFKYDGEPVGQHIASSIKEGFNLDLDVTSAENLWVASDGKTSSVDATSFHCLGGPVTLSGNRTVTQDLIVHLDCDKTMKLLEENDRTEKDSSVSGGGSR